METKLIRIAELAKVQPNMKFTSLAHLLNEENLKQCHHELPDQEKQQAFMEQRKKSTRKILMKILRTCSENEK